MSKEAKEYQKYEQILIDEKKNILERLGRFQKQMKNIIKEDALVGDMVDHANNLLQKRKRILFAEEEKKKLEVIEQALIKIQLKTYGICIQCGRKIQAERLMAIPWANLCIFNDCARNKKIEKTE